MKERRRASVAPIWAEIPKSAGDRRREKINYIFPPYYSFFSFLLQLSETGRAVKLGKG